jgi:hypothetical protein
MPTASLYRGGAGQITRVLPVEPRWPSVAEIFFVRNYLKAPLILEFQNASADYRPVYFAETASADLLDDPVSPDRGRRGRPRQLATSTNARNFNALRAAIWTPAQIARALGISAPTLRKHYFAEMKRRPGGGTRPGADRPRGATSRKRDGLVAALESELQAGDVQPCSMRRHPSMLRTIVAHKARRTFRLDDGAGCSSPREARDPKKIEQSPAPERDAAQYTLGGIVADADPTVVENG